MNWRGNGRIVAAVGFVVAGSLMTVASSGSLAGAAKIKAKSVIVIGNEADLTGNATVGIPGNYGVRFAIHQINAHGGVNGHKLKLVTGDSQGSATGGIAAIRQLIESDHVSMIVNTASSDATIPGLQIAQSASTPIIVSAASDPVIILPINTFVYMSPAVPVNVDVSAYLKYMKSKGYSSVALIYDTAAFANKAVSLFQADAPAVGINLATVQSFPYGTTDFSSQISAAQSSGAQAVFVIGDFIGSVLKQARSVGYSVPFMYDASATDPLLIKSLGDSVANGLVSFQTQATQLLDATTPPMTTWLSQFKKVFPNAAAGVPTQFSLEGYEATFVAAQAISKTLSAKKPLTGRNIRIQLNKLTNFRLGVTAFKWAPAIAYPVSFSVNDHAGDHTVTPVVVSNGVWTKIK
jgi:branched-chain amino acid transport system substrate-binding protein